MISSRWRKVLRDIWRNKGRSLLVILSITVGVFSVGTVVQLNEIVVRDMFGSYERSKPANIIITTDGYFDEDLIEVVQEMPEVAVVEGRSQATVRMQAKEGAPSFMLHLTAISNYENMQVNVLHEETDFNEDWPGTVHLPPPENEVVLERTSCLVPRTGCVGQFVKGDTVRVETPMGQQRDVRVAGLVGDYTRRAAPWQFASLGYVTPETMEWLGLSSDYNELVIRVTGDGSDEAYNQRVAEKVTERVERTGLTVLYGDVPTPNELPQGSIIDSLLMALSAMGVLALSSSVFLLINTMQALLAQQVLQIGVMKAVGARGRDIAALYVVMILIFSLLALLIAAPLGAYISVRVLSFMEFLINFDLRGVSLPPRVLLIEAGLALLVPLLAGLWPILSGVRVTVREAISDYGLGEGGSGEGLIDRLIEGVRGLPRPLLLSLRNTFRRKGRLALTLVTLILAGTIFIAVISVRASMTDTMEGQSDFLQWDLQLFLDRPHRIDRLENLALSAPGVAAIESLSMASAHRLLPDGTEGSSFVLIGVLPETKVFQPEIVKGRWLLPQDKNAVVVNTLLIQDEPDLDVGDDVLVEIQDRETTWRIVGIMRPSENYSEVYANGAYLSRMTRSVGDADRLLVVTEQHDPVSRAQASGALVDQFDQEGIGVMFAITVSEAQAAAGQLYTIQIGFLFSMALLMAIVGVISLTGTMLLNVLERIREVGVMRAIGAGSDAVLQIFIVEGMIIGLISWAISVVLAWPLGKFLSAAMGESLVGWELDYTFSLPGVGIWLVAAIVLSAASSYFPAQNAARLTVREVLAYEG